MFKDIPSYGRPM